MTSKLEDAVDVLRHAEARHREARERHDQLKKDFDAAEAVLHLSKVRLVDAERTVLATVRREGGRAIPDASP